MTDGEGIIIAADFRLPRTDESDDVAALVEPHRLTSTNLSPARMFATAVRVNEIPLQLVKRSGDVEIGFPP